MIAISRAVNECPECNGTGYIIKHHERLTCEECCGKGIFGFIIGKPLSNLQKSEAERKAKIQDKIWDMEEEIEDLQEELECKEDEIDDINTHIEQLRRSISTLREDCV